MFKVLPTDPRFYNLTYEQKELIFQHMILDNPKLRAVINPGEGDKDPEVYYDPDFDKYWDSHGQEYADEDKPTNVDDILPPADMPSSEISEWEEVE